MVLLKKQKNILIIIITCLVIVVLSVFTIRWLLILQKAHGNFENYYAFRGCVQLLEKTNNYGICKTTAGKVIKIIKIQNRWYLEGDGPGVW